MVVHCAVALSNHIHLPLSPALVQENDFRTVETLELSPLPCLANLSQAEYGLQIENLIAEVVAETPPNAGPKARWFSAPSASRSRIRTRGQIAPNVRRRRASTRCMQRSRGSSAPPTRPSRRPSEWPRRSSGAAICEPDSRKGVFRQLCRSAPDRELKCELLSLVRCLSQGRSCARLCPTAMSGCPLSRQKGPREVSDRLGGARNPGRE